MSTTKPRRRGRPKKAEGSRKDVDLRIPVTPEQKELVSYAAKASGEDMAAWARPILLRAAHERVAAIENVKS